jgi:hypothetical protein
MSRHQNTITCLNCGNRFTGKYCNDCGQKADSQKLTATQLLEETIHSLTHYEKGFLHTVWCFLARPGSTCLNFLNGKRKEYQRPVSYILILTGVYIVVHNLIISRWHLTYELWANTSIMTGKANIYLRTHFTPFIFLILVASALIIYLILGKHKFNFIEMLTLCLYGGGTYFMMLTVSDILLGALLGVNIISMNVFLYQTILSSVYTLWVCYDVFKRVSIHFLWVRLIVTAVLISITGYSIMTYIPLLLI